MNAHVLIILLCIVHWTSLPAQYSILSGSYDIRSAATGKAGVAQREPDSYINNPAHLGMMPSSAAYAQWLGHYFVRDLSASQLQVIIKPTAPGCFGINLQTDGGTEYRESVAGLSYGRRIARSGYMGASLNLHTENRPESGTSIGVVPVAGIQWTVIPRVTIGTSIVHPVPVNHRTFSTIPPVFRFGVGYSVYEKLYLTGEMMLSGADARDLRIGFEYKPSQSILISTGYCGKGIISFGTGYQMASFRIRTFCQIHPDLGISTGIGLIWLVKKSQVRA